MSQIYLCFLWHMHQPYYKDLATGEYKLPWTRMHALKDYYGMVRILEEFPQIHQTFNLVPSMMAQLVEYAEGKAADPYLQMALRPAESLSPQEREFLLRHSFYSDPQHMIRRYPRYAELYDAWQAQKNSGSRSLFGVQEFRDLQMWSQLAWFDEEFQAHDPEVSDWVRRGRNFTIADQQRMGAKQREIIGHVLPEYRKLASAGRIEISTTPYYHPILPLLCDSKIAGVSHPGVPLPPRFHYPQDARRQLAMARESIAQYFGAAPAGLWPSEGSVSDEALCLAAELGFEWTATDSGVLNRTLGRGVSVDGLYRPYQWRQGSGRLGVIFRDHFLSDLIGFVYSKMEAHAAAADFLRRIRENCGGILSSGRNALVPIILDGENAWEYYDGNGREFLRELYRSIDRDPAMRAVTVSEGLRLMPPEPLDHIFPGSWINANFDVWIGAEEDNEAWSHLLRARQTFDATAGVSEEQRHLAMEELLIAEGSDWCWWYGPEHDSANRVEFDELFRSHLANVYRFLNLAPPDALSRPILRAVVPELVTPPSGAIMPVIDGEISSYFEWIGAGSYRVDARSGSMHGKKFLVDEVLYGSDGQNLFLRLDFRPGCESDLAGSEVRLVLQTLDRARNEPIVIGLRHGGATAPSGVECAFGRVLEARIPLASAGIPSGAGLRFQFSLWQGGLPLDAIPQQGWLEMPTTDPVELVS
ncbi:MAG TPA: glycoside hydrolase family 57 protein [Bryobacteraceae bacterium]|nr:glycoside hydrolase family 57 protein [Bryobacteraceae bacterium]